MRERLDLLLVNAGFFSSREKARSAIMAGQIRQGTHILDKAGLKLKELPDDLTIKGNDCPYASRGGFKLAEALKVFNISPQSKVCLDVGASTGGFTDCLLQAGAKQVYAVDVGYGQLDWKLRQDERVICLEKVNARYLTPEALYGAEGSKASLAVMDVSFISILKIFPALNQLLDQESTLISLIKPQFEAPRKDNQKGIVKDPQAHLRVLQQIHEQSPETGWFLHQAISSPIKGKGGNREFLGVFYKYPASDTVELEALIRNTTPNE